jgi:hypothetical protein
MTYFWLTFNPYKILTYHTLNKFIYYIHTTLIISLATRANYALNEDEIDCLHLI